jgi:nucleoside-diphosphate-sugar epimerase
VLEAPDERVRGMVLNVGSNENNVRILNLAYRVRDAVPGSHVEVSGTDPDLRDYNVNFDRLHETLDWHPERGIDEGVAEVLGALRSGLVDPDDRRFYTLKQYVFLAEVERTFREMAIDGNVLS